MAPQPQRAGALGRRAFTTFRKVTPSPPSPQRTKAIRGASYDPDVKAFVITHYLNAQKP